MNKKLITLAVAAALTAPAAAFAEATIYGTLHESIDYVDVDDFALWGAVPIRSSGDADLPAAAAAYGGMGLNGRYSDASVVPGNTAGSVFLNTGPAPGNDPGNVTPGSTIPVGSDDVDVGIARAADVNTILTNTPAGTTSSVAADGSVTYDIGGTGTQILQEGTAARAYGGATRAYNDAFNEAIGAGATQSVAEVRGLQAATNFASLNTTGAQKLDAATWAAIQGAGSVTERGDGEYKGWGLGMNPRSNRIGLKGSEDLGGGLKAIYQVEIGVDLSNDNRDNNIINGNRGKGASASAFSMRNSFVGLAGNFGTFLIGRHDTPYKISMGKLDMFADTMADFNHTVGFNDIRADSIVAYISPSFSGFQLAAAVIPQGGATALGSYNKDANSFADSYSIAGIYKNGPFYGSVGYEALGNENWKTADPWGTGIELRDWYRGLYGKNADDDTKWSIGLGLLDWNGFTLSGRYEGRSSILGAPKASDSNLWQIQSAYAFGNNTIKGMYGGMDLDECADPFAQGFAITCDRGGLGLTEQKNKSTWAVAFDHNFSKRTRAYVLYTAVDDDNKNGDWSAFSLGMIHKF